MVQHERWLPRSANWGVRSQPQRHSPRPGTRAHLPASRARRAPGRAEAVVRGHKSGLLTAADYNNLSQCETLDDVKLNLVRGRLAGPATRSGRPGGCGATPAPNSHGHLPPRADRHRLRGVPGERGLAAGDHHDRGEVHAEAGGRLEPHAVPGEPPQRAAAARSTLGRVGWLTRALSGMHSWAHACDRRSTHLHAAPQADTTLGQFMDFCTYGHMIDNVVLIVTGTLHERDVQVRGLGPGRGRGCWAGCPPGGGSAQGPRTGPTPGVDSIVSAELAWPGRQEPHCDRLAAMQAFKVAMKGRMGGG